jgi:DNA-binding NarL/FixJ family response regulator
MIDYAQMSPEARLFLGVVHRDASLAGLPSRLHEVYKMVRKGQRIVDIANALGRNRSTVRGQVQQLKKLGVTT